MSRTLIAILFVFLPLCAEEAAPVRVGVGLAQRKLSLAEAIELAMRGNLDIEIENTNTAAAREAVRAARGFLDPNFRWNPLAETRNTPTSSVLMGQDGKLRERLHAQNLSFRQRLPWQGSGFHVDFDNSRQSTSNPFVSLNPYLVSRLTLGFSQPLVRNRLIDRERSELRIRNKQVELSEADFEVKVIDVVTRVEQAYWDLVAARRDVEVQADSVNLAREQLARSRRMVESGTLAPVELAAAEAELARRLDTWHASAGILTQVENTLKALLTGSREDALWGEEIVPTQVSTLEPPAADNDLRKAVEQALRQRPEFRQLSLRTDANEIQKNLYTDQTKPQVNLVAAYANSGLAGTLSAGENPFSAVSRLQVERLNELSRRVGLAPLPPVSFGGMPEVLIGGYGSALSSVFGGRYQSVQVGLTLDWNPRNRAAEAGLAQTVISERRLKLEQARLEQLVEAQVRNALQAIQSARQRITAAEASARAAEEKLASEIRLFQTGESTNFLVLTRQNELADSRRRVVLAHLDFNKAVSRLHQALGATLEAHRISLR